MKRTVLLLCAFLIPLPAISSVSAVAAEPAAAKKAASKKSKSPSVKTAKKQEESTPSKPTESKEAKAAEPDDLSAGAPSLPPAGSSPMVELKKSDQALKKLFQRSAPSWSPEQDAKRNEMRKIVSSFLDYEELARRALAKHWDTIPQASRKEFVVVLRDLIERNYIRQVHGQANYELQFAKESVDGSNATVNATLKTMANGKKVNIEMEYKLLYKGKSWLVFDVITDEQSMLENYRAEFGKVIVKEGFDTLLKRMKKRLEKLD